MKALFAFTAAVVGSAIAIRGWPIEMSESVKSEIISRYLFAIIGLV